MHIKDKKISILKATVTGTNEIGEEITEWIPLPDLDNIWAYYRQLSGSEFWAAHRENVKEEVLFEINWRDDVDTTCQIRYKGEDYSITRIDNFEGYKDNLKIYAYKIN